MGYQVQKYDTHVYISEKENYFSLYCILKLLFELIVWEFLEIEKPNCLLIVEMLLRKKIKKKKDFFSFTVHIKFKKFS